MDSNEIGANEVGVTNAETKQPPRKKGRKTTAKKEPETILLSATALKGITDGINEAMGKLSKAGASVNKALTEALEMLDSISKELQPNEKQLYELDIDKIKFLDNAYEVAFKQLRKSGNLYSRKMHMARNTLKDKLKR